MNLKKIFLFNFIILFVFFSFFEIFIRFFNLADLTGVSKNLIVQKKGINYNAPNITGKAFGKTVYTDNFGFRVPENNYTYKDKKLSILILGDSVSFGVGVDEEKTFVGMLRDEFNNINLFNSSVSGYSLKEFPKIIKLNKNIENLNEVILFYTLNDISFEQTLLNVDEEFQKSKTDKKLSFYDKLKKNYYLIKINAFLRNKSASYMWLRGNLTNPSDRHFFYTFPIYKNKNAVKNLNLQFKKLNEVLVEENFNFTVVILPYEFQSRKQNCNEDYLIPQNEVKKILNNININFLDYSKIFCNHYNPKKLFLKYDPVHLSEEGHNLVFLNLKKDLNF